MESRYGPGQERKKSVAASNKSFRKLQKVLDKMCTDLSEYSGLPKDLVEKIIYYAKCLPKAGSKEIDRVIFMAQMSRHFDITNAFMSRSMYEAIKHPRHKTATIEEYARCICTMLSPSLDTKIDFVYTVYDMNNDGSISYTELYYFLKPCVISAEDDIEPGDNAKELVDLVLKTTDFDESGSVDLDEFRTLVKKDVLYLQLLGPCLPGEVALKSFRKLFDDKSAFEIRAIFANERAESLQSVESSIDTGYYPIQLELP